MIINPLSISTNGETDQCLCLMKAYVGARFNPWLRLVPISRVGLVKSTPQTAISTTRDIFTNWKLSVLILATPDDWRRGRNLEDGKSSHGLMWWCIRCCLTSRAHFSLTSSWWTNFTSQFIRPPENPYADHSLWTPALRQKPLPFLPEVIGMVIYRRRGLGASSWELRAGNMVCTT